MPYHVSGTDIECFQQSGVTVLRNVLSKEQLETIKKGIDKGCANPSPRHTLAKKEKDTGRSFEDFNCWQDIPEYREIIFKSELPRIAAELLGSHTVRLHHDHILVKEPVTEVGALWHQDTPYYSVEGNQTLTYWIPIDPVPEGSAMEYIVGSHKQPWKIPSIFRDQFEKHCPKGSHEEMPDIQSHRAEYPIVTYAMEPGDVLAYNFSLLHLTKGAKQLRRVFAICYVGDDAVFAPRPWPTLPPFPELVNGPLSAGQPLNHKLFPVVYSRENSKL